MDVFLDLVAKPGFDSAMAGKVSDHLWPFRMMVAAAMVSASVSTSAYLEAIDPLQKSVSMIVASNDRSPEFDRASAQHLAVAPACSQNTIIRHSDGIDAL